MYMAEEVLRTASTLQAAARVEDANKPAVDTVSLPDLVAGPNGTEGASSEANRANYSPSETDGAASKSRVSPVDHSYYRADPNVA